MSFMSATEWTLLAFVVGYVAVVLFLWKKSQIGDRDAFQISDFFLALLYPIVVPVLIVDFLTAKKNPDLKRIDYEKRQAVEHEFHAHLSQSVQNLQKADDLSPSDRDKYVTILQHFRSGKYDALEHFTVTRHLASLWDAKERPQDFIESHFRKLLAPPDEEFQQRDIRYQLAPYTDWYLAMTKSFLDAVQSIDRKLQGRILEALTDLARDPLTARGDTVKPLTKDLAGLWRYRLGDFRLIYQPMPEKKQVLLVSFGSRGSIYD